MLCHVSLCYVLAISCYIILGFKYDRYVLFGFVSNITHFKHSIHECTYPLSLFITRIKGQADKLTIKQAGIIIIQN